MRKMLLATVAALGLLVLVTPASAIVIGGVDYVLLARSEILMEGSKANCVPPNLLGCMIIDGNIAVNEPLPNSALQIFARIRMGQNNTINGTATAHTINFGNNASVTICRFDVAGGVNPNLVCGTQEAAAPFLPIVPGWFPLGQVAINNAVNAAPNFTCAAGATCNLPPGVYRDIRLEVGSTVNLSPGAYTARNFRMLNGSTLNGAGQTVNVQVQFITEAGVAINDVNIHSPSGSPNFTFTESIKIFNNSVLNNVVLYAPNSAIHLHTGLVGTNVEAVANYITVQPVLIRNEQLEDCGCFTTVQSAPNSITLGAGHNLLAAERFFLSPTCDVAAGVEVPATSQSATSATLDTTGVAPGTYKVIGEWSSGIYCNNTLVTIP